MSTCAFGQRLHQLCNKPLAPPALAVLTAASTGLEAPAIPCQALLDCVPTPATGHTLELARLVFSVLGGTTGTLLALGRHGDAERLVLERGGAWASTVCRLLHAASAAGWATGASADTGAAGGAAPAPNPLVATLAGVRAFQQGVCDGLVKAAAAASPALREGERRSGPADALLTQLRLRSTAFQWLCKTAACRTTFRGDPLPAFAGAPQLPPYAASPSALLLHVLGASRWSVDDYLKQAQAAGSGGSLQPATLRPALDACRQLYASIRESFPQQAQPAAAGGKDAPSAPGTQELVGVWASGAVHDAYVGWMQRYAKLCRAAGDHRAAGDVTGSALSYLQRRVDAAGAPDATPRGVGASERTALLLTMVELRAQAAIDAVSCAQPQLAALHAAALAGSSEGEGGSSVATDVEQCGRHLQGALGLLQKVPVEAQSSEIAAAAARLATSAEAVLEVWQAAPLAPVTLLLTALAATPKGAAPTDWLSHLEQTASAAAKHCLSLPAAGPEVRTAAVRLYGVACTSRLLRLHTAPVASVSLASRAPSASDALARLRACGLMSQPLAPVGGDAFPSLDDDVVRRLREACAYASKASAALLRSDATSEASLSDTLGALGGVLGPLHNSAVHYLNHATHLLSGGSPPVAAAPFAELAAHLLTSVCSGWDDVATSLPQASLSNAARSSVLDAAKLAQRYQLLSLSYRILIDATALSSGPSPLATTNASSKSRKKEATSAAAGQSANLFPLPAALQSVHRLLKWSLVYVRAFSSGGPSDDLEAASVSVASYLRKGGAAAVISAAFTSGSATAAQLSSDFCDLVEAAGQLISQFGGDAAKVPFLACRAVLDALHRAAGGDGSAKPPLLHLWCIEAAISFSSGLLSRIAAVSDLEYRLWASSCLSRFLDAFHEELPSPPSDSTSTAPSAVVAKGSPCYQCAPLQLLSPAASAEGAPAHAVLACALAAMSALRRGCVCPGLSEWASASVFRSKAESWMRTEKSLYPIYALHAHAAASVLGLSNLVHQCAANPPEGSAARPGLHTLNAVCAAFIQNGDSVGLSRLLASVDTPTSGVVSDALAGIVHSAIANSQFDRYCGVSGASAQLDAAQEHASLAVKALTRARGLLGSEVTYQTSSTAQSDSDDASAAASQLTALLFSRPGVAVEYSGLNLALADRLASALELGAQLWALRGEPPRATYLLARAAGVVKSAGGAFVTDDSGDVPRFQRLLGEACLSAAASGSRTDLDEQLSLLAAHARFTSDQLGAAAKQPLSPGLAHVAATLAHCVAVQHARHIDVAPAGISVSTHILTAVLQRSAPLLSPALSSFALTAVSQLAAQSGDFAASATAAKTACQLLDGADDVFGVSSIAHHMHGAALLRFGQAKAARAELTAALGAMVDRPHVYHRPHHARSLCRVLALAEHRLRAEAQSEAPAGGASVGAHVALVFASIAPAVRYRCLYNLAKQGQAAAAAEAASALNESSSSSASSRGGASADVHGARSSILATLEALRVDAPAADCDEAACLDPLRELRSVYLDLTRAAADKATTFERIRGGAAWPAAPLVALAVEYTTRTLLVARWESPPAGGRSTLAGPHAGSMQLYASSLRYASDEGGGGSGDGSGDRAARLGAMSGDLLDDACAEFDAILRASGSSLGVTATAAAIAAGLGSGSSVNDASPPSGTGLTAQEPDGDAPEASTGAPSAASGRTGRSASVAAGSGSRVGGGKIAAVAAARDSESGSRGKSAAPSKRKGAPASAPGSAATSPESTGGAEAGPGKLSQSERDAWWVGRHALDARLSALCDALQTQLLGPALAALALPPAEDDSLASSLSRLAVADDAGPEAATGANSSAAGAAECDLDELKVGDLKRLLGERGLSQAGKRPELVARLQDAMGAERSGAGTIDRERKGVAAAPASGPKAPSSAPRALALVLSEELQHLPWESMPSLRAAATGSSAGDEAVPPTLTRLPTHALAFVHWNRALRRGAAADADAGTQLAALAGVQSCRPAPAPASSPSPASAPARGYAYVVNPSGDLSRTQRVLQPVLDLTAQLAAANAGGMRVRGVAGSPPAPGQLADLLAHSDVYLYCGHGGGEAYLPRESLATGGGGGAAVGAGHTPLGLAPGCTPAPPALLMGCSSGRLVRRGPASEPDGLVLALLSAGCPAVVGALWDVTDKDIDRYTAALLGAWLLPPGALEGVDGQGGPGGAGVGQTQPWLPLAVAASRAVCRLPFLVGAAPVVYGLPLAAVP